MRISKSLINDMLSVLEENYNIPFLKLVVNDRRVRKVSIMPNTPVEDYSRIVDLYDKLKDLIS